MRSLHLKQVGKIWYFQRRRPVEFSDVEPRKLIRFSLKTRDFAEARALAANYALQQDKDWTEALKLGRSLASQVVSERYAAAIEVNRIRGLSNKPASQLAADELVKRLRCLLNEPAASQEQRAVLGLVKQPKLSLTQAFDRFWDYIKDEWMVLSRDQQRVKRNIYLKAIRNFETVNGAIPLHDIKREHSLAFRAFWLKRVEDEGLKPYTGNREINSLRRLINVNYDIDSCEQQNPFLKVRLKDNEVSQRKPFTTEFIQQNLADKYRLKGLREGLSPLIRLLINTGLRPTEAIGLELPDFNLGGDVPHVHIRRNQTRSLKNAHSERLIPLVGVSLVAAHEVVGQGGWGKWLGKNMYATSEINKFFRGTELITDPNLSLYSLRHWFQDQLTKHDVIDRAQAQLMGHKFQRPKYGLGKDLEELSAIIEKFAIR